MALSEDPAAVLQLPETRKSLFQLERLIESGLSEDRYAPAREYLRMNVKSIAKSIDNGDFQQAETQFRVFSLQMASADRMLSFDVSSEPTRVKIQLYASLDVAPRHEYYTDQRIHAVVPGSYRLLASKHGYADAAIPNLDLFSIRPSLITCEMSATPGSPSVCRIEVQP